MAYRNGIPVNIPERALTGGQNRADATGIGPVLVKLWQFMACLQG